MGPQMDAALERKMMAHRPYKRYPRRNYRISEIIKSGYVPAEPLTWKDYIVLIILFALLLAAFIGPVLLILKLQRI